MDTVKKLFSDASKAYNRQAPHYEKCLQLIMHCYRKLQAESNFRHYGDFYGNPRVRYSVFGLGDSVSRPIRGDLYVDGEKQFLQEHELVVGILPDPNHVWTTDDYNKANRVVYTAVMAVASCFDLWQPGSRKTPGTFFEVFMAGLLQSAFHKAVFSKHIPLAKIVAGKDKDVGLEAVNEVRDKGPLKDEKASVSTDVVVGVQGCLGGVVIPLKITTRERIVQPFAHQRILDAAFGKGHFQSLIVCISETQLDKKRKRVQQVCVPGTIKLFQKYLANVSGLYYCDLPQRYGTTDLEGIVNVRSVGHLFEDIRAILVKITLQEAVKAG
jgi:hypothetical protein